MDTEGRDHATVLCREAADEGYDVVVAFGGDGTVNEAANGLAHSATPLSCLPGGATNVYCRMLGVPERHRRRHRAPAARRRRLDAAPGRPRPRQRPRLHVLGGLRARRRGRAPRRRAPEASRRACGSGTSPTPAVATFAREYVVRPPRLEATSAARSVRGVTAARAERRPLHLLRPSPDPRRRRARARRRTLRRRHARARGADRHADRHAPACSPIACASPSTSASSPSRARQRAHRLGRRAPGRAPGRRRLHRRHGRGGLRRLARGAHGRRLSAGRIVVERGGHVESVHRFAWRLGRWRPGRAGSSCARRPSRCRPCRPCRPASSSA